MMELSKLYIPLLQLLVLGLCVFGADLQTKTSSGQLQGFSPYKGIQAYLGIPYAQPPIGDLRFAPPQHLTTPFSGTLDATKFGPACIQFSYKGLIADRGGLVTGESEDCLTINVWTHDKAKGLPVLVYIPGGGWVSGGSSIVLYDPIEIVKSHRDVIVVTFNYRLNLFGFPNTSALGKLNPGLRDQRVAIEWLQKNIAAFGGDPKRITIIGESAGPMSVSAYGFAYASDPIVAGMGMVSGQAVTIQRDLGEEWPRIANATGCTNADKQAELACMRKVPARDLKFATSPSLINYFADPSGGTPAVDNETFFSIEEYVRRGKAGNFSRVPVLIGNTNDEGQGLVPYHPVNGVDELFAKNLTEFVFQCPTAQHSADLVTAGVPTWRYRYMGVWPSVTPYKWMKSFHGTDIPMWFGTYSAMQFQPPSKDEIAASKLAMHAWVSFAKDPQNGLQKELGWPHYQPGKATLVELFRDNQPNATFANSEEYDAVCATPAIPTGKYGPYC